MGRAGPRTCARAARALAGRAQLSIALHMVWGGEQGARAKTGQVSVICPVMSLALLIEKRKIVLVDVFSSSALLQLYKAA